MCVNVYSCQTLLDGSAVNAQENMSQGNLSRYTVPDELRDMLLEFTISYLLEQPPDIVDYAVEFFTKLRETRGAVKITREDTTATSPTESVLSVEEGEWIKYMRAIVEEHDVINLPYLSRCINTKPNTYFF